MSDDMSSQRDKIREQLSAYVDGELTAAQARQVQEAVARDPGLAAELEALRSVRGLVGRLPRASAPAGIADWDELGQIELARFINPAGLLSQGRNLFRESEASGDPILSAAGEEGAGTLRQTFLEASNVSVVDEIVQLIVTQRAFEINSSVINTSDEMLQTANNMRQ